MFSVAPPDLVADDLKLSAATGPLPSDAYKANISFAYEPPAKLYAGERASLHLLVKNVSSLNWPCEGQQDEKYQIKLGNRWLDQNGDSDDDGRSALSYDLGPGDQAEVLLTITAPDVSGDYLLEFDLVQEQVTWFSVKGSEKLRQKVTVQ